MPTTSSRLRRNGDRSAVFTRRALLLGGLNLGLMGMLAGRLYWLQAIEADKYRLLAEDNRLSTRPLVPTRGLIVDRTGALLAANRSDFQAVVNVADSRAATIARMTMVLQRLARIVPLGDHERQRIVDQLRRSRSLAPVTVRENLTWDQMAEIEFNTPSLPGVSINVGQSRDYPQSDLVSHIVGYVGAASPEDLQEDDDPMLRVPSVRIGKRGIEKSADKELRGTLGGIQIEVDAFGRELREVARSEGQPGADIRLTLDLELQRFVVDRLEDQSASAVVMDVVTGDVLAMGSVPSFDSNTFARPISSTQWQQLLADPRRPLLNKAAQGAYPPGSTYKIVTALAALESKALTLTDRIYCSGSIDLPGTDQKKHCWIYPGGHGSLNVVEALQHSCDVFFYEAAKRAGVDRIVETAAKLGFGKPTGVGLPEETGGLLPTRSGRLERQGRPWTVGDTYNLGIGQGDMLATPLQLAVMAARIANGGYDVKPRLVAGMSCAHQSISPLPVQSAVSAPSLQFQRQNVEAVQEGLGLVVNSPAGTAFGARIVEKGMTMAGKTGTSQVRRMTEGELDRRVSQQALPWHLRHHALFCGYAPADNPRYACSVVVEHGMGGALTAAPIARDILIQAQKIDPSRRQDRLRTAVAQTAAGSAVREPMADHPAESRGSKC